jgi:hypothetical protein
MLALIEELWCIVVAFRRSWRHVFRRGFRACQDYWYGLHGPADPETLSWLFLERFENHCSMPLGALALSPFSPVLHLGMVKSFLKVAIILHPFVCLILEFCLSFLSPFVLVLN